MAELAQKMVTILTGVLGASLWLALFAWSQATLELMPEPGLLYRVVGVAAGDTLNIRQGPGADAQQVGSFSPQARDIAVTGERMPVNGSIWWGVVHSDASIGWVNARYLTPQDPHGGPQGDYPLFCSGTEPFWSLAIGGGEAHYQAPDDPSATYDASDWNIASGRGETFAIALRGEGDDGSSGPGYVAVARSINFCSDGMSDIQNPFQAVVIRPEGEVLDGCCRRAAQ
jgi:uncharacterized membrane protein